MNDLELIRSLYAGVPDPDAADRAARVALDALRAQMDSPAPAPRRPSQGRRRSRRPRLALAFGGACVLLAAGAVVLSDSDSTLAPGPETAAAFLNQAARSAAQSDEPWRLGPGQYWYVSSKIVNTGSAARCDGPVKQDLQDLPKQERLHMEDARGGFLIRGDCGTISRENWEAIDDSGRSRQTGPTGSDGQAYEADDKMLPHPRGAERPYVDLAGLDISYQELVEMPGDELAERVRQHADRTAQKQRQDVQHQSEEQRQARVWGTDGPTTTGNLFLFVGNLLAEDALSPDQRAALYRMIAQQLDVRSLGEVTDPEGRRGVAVGRGEEGHEAMIVFDPSTSKVLATGRGLAGRTPPAGSDRAQYLVFLKSGVVNSTSETP